MIPIRATLVDKLGREVYVELVEMIPIRATHIKCGDGGTAYASVLEAEF